MARNSRITMMVPDELKEELRKLSSSMYMTESSLCAYIVSQWMHTQKQVNDKLMGTLSPENLQQMIASNERPQGMEGETK